MKYYSHRYPRYKRTLINAAVQSNATAFRRLLVVFETLIFGLSYSSAAFHFTRRAVNEALPPTSNGRTVSAMTEWGGAQRLMMTRRCSRRD